MKVSNLLGKAKGSALLLLGTASVVVSMDANAIPVFARQTGFKCVACHVGGMFPQLTSLGRMFKLTGYTMGNRPNLDGLEVQNDYPPVAIMVQGARQYYNNSVTGQMAGHGQGVPSSAFDLQVVSLFAGGKITDNFGAFMQWTGQKYDNAQTGSQAGYGSAAIDNTEFRYADRTVTPNNDLVLGAYINNRAMMSDVWNNFGAWESGWINYFNGGNAQAPTTYMMGESSQHAAVGVGGYFFKDKTWYGELAVYKSPTHGPFSVLTAGATSVGNAGVTSLLEPSPYFRFAYNKEWGASSFEAGLHGMMSYVYGTPLFGTSNSQPGGPVSAYHDVGLDAQYQYVLDPHYFAAHARVTRELMNNTPGVANWQGVIANNATDNLTETYMDATYVYEAKYGAQLSYASATGSNDAGLYAMTTAGSPDWKSWTPNIFWQPYQNLRIGYMYTFYTQMGGVNSGNGLTLNGAKFTPANFNTSMLYVGFIY
ncbi:hypothetical protein [Ferrovum myxofaciens]|uniref:hypothetical protein n=1 Tax=Ferrovum myxofaciens TaxID=416213 RepID=UPI0023556ED8|nr:hypothetical protein [Ferrovum myxofaciens]MBU6994532.1 hypothetical protein [Ferrovum myxofaciens]